MRRFDKVQIIAIIISIVAAILDIAYVITSEFKIEKIPIIVLLSAIVLISVAIVFLWSKIFGTIKRHQIRANLKEIMRHNPYDIFHATEEDVLWAADMAPTVYQGLDVIPHETMLKWFRANPTGFFVIKNRNTKQRVGNLDILPLKLNTLTHFLNGDIVEQQFGVDDIFTPSERDKIENLYIESIVIHTKNSKAVSSCIFSAIEIGEHICKANRIKKIYSIAANKSGKALIQRLGFLRIDDGEKRRDGHEVFEVESRRLLSILADIATSPKDRKRFIDYMDGLPPEPTL